jgi:hypothetical protein
MGVSGSVGSLITAATELREIISSGDMVAGFAFHRAQCKLQDVAQHVAPHSSYPAQTVRFHWRRSASSSAVITLATQV